jgi:hypothetical protein
MVEERRRRKEKEFHGAAGDKLEILWSRRFPEFSHHFW